MDSQPVRRSDVITDKSGDENLLREIREDFSYFRDFWADNHEEMRVDLRYISGDPWSPEDRAAREDNSRPVLCPDELSQYQNATINNLRQNKRAIQVNPRGNGATDKDAETRSAIIKGIEYKSNAQSAYTNAFENQINCGMGFFRITTKAIGKDGEVEPWIKGIENPLSVLLDPNAKEQDFCDQKRCFVMDIMRLRDFERQYPKAQKRSFTGDDMSIAPDWFQAENIMIAEYWRIDGYDENGDGGKVTQYITNGVEILDRTDWPGSWIPIIPVMGKKVYVPFGTAIKRFYYSQIRLARGPQMMLAYGASQEAEIVGMMPRTPLMMYVGQDETDKEALTNLNTTPRSYILIDPVVDQATGQVLPLPTRVPYGPDISAYEAFNERWRRAIQAALGISPLPTAAQRQNEKSGVALDRIQQQQAVGSFHFSDNFDRSIENAGRQIDELITLTLDTPRQVTARQPDDSHDMVHIAPGGQGAPPDVTPESVFDPARGEFDVTISAGMSYQSQRQQGSDFADKLLEQLNELPIPPQAKASLIALSIKLKSIGPIGDEMAQIIDPQSDQGPIPPQAQQAMAQLQQQGQELHVALQQATMKIQELEFEKKAQVVKGQNDIVLKQMQIEADITVAEIETKAQNLSERLEFVHDMVKQLQANAHESALSSQEAQQTQDQQAQQQQSLQEQQGAQDGQTQQPEDASQQAVQPAQSPTG